MQKGSFSTIPVVEWFWDMEEASETWDECWEVNNKAQGVTCVYCACGLSWKKELLYMSYLLSVLRPIWRVVGEADDQKVLVWSHSGCWLWECVMAWVLCLSRNDVVELEGANESPKEWEQHVMPKGAESLHCGYGCNWDSSTRNWHGNKVT